MDGRDDGRRARIDRLVVGGPARPWADLGLLVSDAQIALPGTGLQVTGDGDPGLRAWLVSGVDPSVEEVDGVATLHGEPAHPPAPGDVDHPLGALSIDHVVVNTDSLDRTCGAIADTLDAPLKRVRDLGSARQGFHRVGHRRDHGLILEVVERPDAPPGRASLWGLVLVVDDLDAAFRHLGPDLLSPPKDAVQPGRRIATLRSEAGLGLPVALMTPDP